MRVLTITCMTGGVRERNMTEQLMVQLENGYNAADCHGSVVCVLQGTHEHITSPLPLRVPPAVRYRTPRFGTNKGFARGMNAALFAGAFDEKFDAVLCINNDVEPPEGGRWLDRLLRELWFNPDKVIVPTTNYTGVKEQERQLPTTEEPFDLPETPAVCWLLSWHVCERVFARSKPLQLFREDFGPAWGEDTYASALLRKVLDDPKPFRVVPEAWIKHIGAVTSSHVKPSVKMEAVRRARAAIAADGLA